jgi:diguanylate cyclase (GGDEF)-like protein
MISLPNFFDILTLMLCTGLVTLVVALVLTFVWAFERSEKAVGWWCAATWTLTIGLVILSFRTATPMWFGIALGNATVIMGYALVGAGFTVFARKSVHWTLLAAGPAIWIASLVFSEAVREDINLRIIILSVIVVAYTLIAAHASLETWRKERLPSALLAFLFYVCHVAVYSLRIPLAWFYPLDARTFLQGFNWFSLLALEGFIQATFSSFVFVILVRERAERRYRMAAEIDSLTSIASRRYFVAETKAALARKPKAGALAVMDLDYFKKINDTFGHMAGDRVLQQFSRNVADQLEPGMVFGRLGGEEFGLFMADMGEDAAAVFLEKLRSGTEALDMHFNGHVLKVTASIGAASVEDAGLDFDHLMAGADNALYLSKHEGRNRSSFFHPTMRIQKIIEAGKESRISLSKTRISRVSVRNRLGRG